MKALARVIGWLLVIGGLVAVGVIIYSVATGRIAGNFLTGLLLCAPAVLVMVIGGAIARAGRRKDESTTAFGEADGQWTRRRLQ